MNEQQYQSLIHEAEKARRNSYAPYSHFAVGAALLSEDGQVFSGCNIENASYPLGNCAERSAFFKAASVGARRFTAIAIAGGPAGSDVLAACPPCGACRQVMREFCRGDFLIFYSDGAGGYVRRSLDELLPDAFGPDNL